MVKICQWLFVWLLELNDWLNASSFQRFFERSFQRSPTSTLLSRLKQAAEAGRSGQLFRALDVWYVLHVIWVEARRDKNI